MARSASRARVVIRQSYYWPDQQLNFWILVMIATGGTLIGVYAVLVIDQNYLEQGIPWIMPYGICVGALTVLFVFAMLLLIYQRRLLPGLVMIGSFILTVLYITGIVETAIQLFGPQADINSSCQLLTSYHGAPYWRTLQYLEQRSICQSWLAVFAFWIIGAVFLVWMIFLGSSVARGGIGD